MNTSQIFIVTYTPLGEQTQNAVVQGVPTHEKALEEVLKRNPSCEPVAVASLAEIEQTVKTVRQVVSNGSDTQMQLIKVACVAGRDLQA